MVIDATNRGVQHDRAGKSHLVVWIYCLRDPGSRRLEVVLHHRAEALAAPFVDQCLGGVAALQILGPNVHVQVEQPLLIDSGQRPAHARMLAEAPTPAASRAPLAPRPVFPRSGGPFTPIFRVASFALSVAGGTSCDAI